LGDIKLLLILIPFKKIEMAKKVKSESKKQLLKSVKADIRKKIETALTDIKDGFGEKDFRKRVKKASALFSDGISIKKETASPKKEKGKSKKETVGEQVAEVTA
jgi:hypothetical protein